jgi:hypothetical protein
MSATPVSYSTTINPDTHDPDTGTNGSDEETPHSNREAIDLLLPLPRTTLLRQYSSLQDHADQLQDIKTQAGDHGAVQRHEGRRESVVWDRPPAQDIHKYSRNPMIMQQRADGTLPPLQELMRRSKNEDADDTHNANLRRAESRNNLSTSEYPFGLLVRESTESSMATSQSSVAEIPRAAVRNVFNIAPVSLSRNGDEEGNESPNGSTYQDIKANGKERRLSSKLRSALKYTNAVDAISQSTSPSKSFSGDTSLKQLVARPIVKSNLSNRRRVNLELSLPTGNHEPVRNKPAVVHFGGITPSRPRSPQTPFTHSGRPKWQQYAIPNTGRIVEEDYMGQITTPEGNEESGLMPDNDRMGSSGSPKLGPTPAEVRDRYYIAHLRSKRNRRGQSSTSESSLARTPDGSWTSAVARVLPGRQPRTKAELQQFGQTSNSGRASRWRWARSTTRSSEETGQVPSEEHSGRRFFKQSGHILDQMNASKQRKQSSSLEARLWWIRKQSMGQAPVQSSARTNKPTIPLAPTVIRTPTPPETDANGEVKSKLADFFFDDHTGMPVKKSKASPGGHWDSDALLMSYLSTEEGDVDDDMEEEGPMGPLTPKFAARGFKVNQTPGYGSAGVPTAPGHYLEAKGPHMDSITEQGSKISGEDEVWFRVKHEFMSIGTPSPEQTLQEIAARQWFEWVVPEHLPNSPCCPIYPKYQGPHFGMCYWHGKKQVKGKGQRTAGEEYEGGEHDHGNLKTRAQQDDDKGEDSPKIRSGSRDWEFARFEIIPEEGKRRRLASLSGEERMFG